MVMLLLPASAVAVLPVSQVVSSSFHVVAGGQRWEIPCEANHVLSATHQDVDRVVVLLHGTSRNALSAFTTLEEALSLAGLTDRTCLLVAPQFLVEEDVVAFGLPADYLYWEEEGWKQGDESMSTPANPRSAAVSSFAVLDSLLLEIVARNPQVRSLVLAGHSAGAQFIARYAAGSDIESLLSSAYGVAVSYVVANPSSYLYFNSERAIAGTIDRFARPPAAAVSACPGYDDYKYGLQARNSYMKRTTSTDLATRFRGRHVTYLLGALDTDPAAPDLDLTCPGEMQGTSRLERGTVYWHYLQHFFGTSITETQRRVIVPGVGHDSRGMVTSPCGVAALFGTGGCVPVPVDIAANDTANSISIVLRQNQPNPFRGRTAISYMVPDDGWSSTLRIYDVRGRLIRTLHDRPRAGGIGSFVWNGRTERGAPAPAGSYFYRLQHGRTFSTRRLTLL